MRFAFSSLLMHPGKSVSIIDIPIYQFLILKDTSAESLSYISIISATPELLVFCIDASFLPGKVTNLSAKCSCPLHFE